MVEVGESRGEVALMRRTQTLIPTLKTHDINHTNLPHKFTQIPHIYIIIITWSFG